MPARHVIAWLQQLVEALAAALQATAGAEDDVTDQIKVHVCKCTCWQAPSTVLHGGAVMSTSVKHVSWHNRNGATAMRLSADALPVHCVAVPGAGGGGGVCVRRRRQHGALCAQRLSVSRAGPGGERMSTWSLTASVCSLAEVPDQLRHQSMHCPCLASDPSDLQEDLHTAIP